MLKGLKVLDVGAYTVGPGAASILGCLGADVIRIEPPRLDPLYYFTNRQSGVSIAYVSSHFSKRNIILDLKKDADRRTALMLAENSDIFIENHLPGTMQRLGLNYEVVQRLNPRIIYCSSTSYGAQGPLSKLGAADPFMQAATGLAGINGVPGSNGEIFRYVAHLDWTTSLTILQAVLLAVIARERTGAGQKIDTSAFEAGLTLQTTRIAEYFATSKRPFLLGSGNPLIVPSQAFMTADKKYINVSVPREEYWPRLCKSLDLEKLILDPRFNTNETRVKNREQLMPILSERFATGPARWWEIQMSRNDVPCGRYHTLDEIIRDPHIRENEMIVFRQTPWGEVLFGGMPITFGECQSDVDIRGTVAPNQNGKEILCELSSNQVVPAGRACSGMESIRRPLDGIKVLEFSEEIAGPFCAMGLGDAGAEVMKIEPLCGDWSRSLGVKIKGESVLFMSVNRGKKSIAVDYTTDRGREIVRKLLERADIVIESCRPGHADKMGIGFEETRRLNPKIIYCSISPFGHKGPYAGRPASELELQGLSGYLSFLGEPGEEPVRLGADVAAMNSAQFAFIGILIALYHRNRMNVGQKVEVSMLGALLTMGQHWMAAHYNPDDWDGFFLSGPLDHAETGYRTKDANIIFGDLDAHRGQGKKAFAEFAKRVGLGNLLDDPWWAEHGYNTLGIGKDAQEFRSVYEAVLANKTAEEMIEIIDSVGGHIGIIKHYDELVNDPQVDAVQMISELYHPVAGKLKTVGIPYKLEKTPCQIKGPAPTLGEHTSEVLLSLGFPEKEIGLMRKERIIL
jgi:CoA:oxalate CoA-transferase